MASNRALQSRGRTLKHVRSVESDETVSYKAGVPAHAALAGSGPGELPARSLKCQHLAGNSSLRLLVSTLLILDCGDAILMVLLTSPLLPFLQCGKNSFPVPPSMFGKERSFINCQVEVGFSGFHLASDGTKSLALIPCLICSWYMDTWPEPLRLGKSNRYWDSNLR
jgi:hypothetical protein